MMAWRAANTEADSGERGRQMSGAGPDNDACAWWWASLKAQGVIDAAD